MNLENIIESKAKEFGHTKKWIAEKMGLNYRTFMYKMGSNSFTTKEVLWLGKVLDINLNEIKEAYLENSQELLWWAEKLNIDLEELKEKYWEEWKSLGK